MESKASQVEPDRRNPSSIDPVGIAPIFQTMPARSGSPAPASSSISCRWAATRTTSNSRWSGCAGTINIEAWRPGTMDEQQLGRDETSCAWRGLPAFICLPAYEDELVEAYAHVRRLVGAPSAAAPRGDEPAHVFDPASFRVRRRAEMMATDLHFLTIAEAAELIAARTLSPVELTDAYLARIAALDYSAQQFRYRHLRTCTPRVLEAAEAEIADIGAARAAARYPLLFERHIRRRGRAHDRPIAAACETTFRSRTAPVPPSWRRPAQSSSARTRHGSSPMAGHPGTCSFRRRAIPGTPIIRRRVLLPAQRLPWRRDLRR